MRSPTGRNSRGRVARYNAMMPRIIRHETVPQSGSYEVRFGDGRASKFFYFDDVPARRLRHEMLPSEQALRWRTPRRLRGLNTIGQDEIQLGNEQVCGLHSEVLHRLRLVVLVF